MMFIYAGTKYLNCKGFRSVPIIVGTMANNVRPVDRLAVTPPRKGSLAPILRWANRIGQDWVEQTVRSYGKGVQS